MKCLIIDKVHASIGEEFSKYMDVETQILPTKEELATLIPECDLLIMRVNPQIDKSVLDAAKKLKAIGVCSVGTDHIDMEYAEKKGIKIYNAPGMNANAVAELTFSKMIDLSRHVMPAHRDVTVNHEWDKYKYFGRELRDHTLGILGFGRIGRRMCEMAKVFQMKVIAYDPFLRLGDFEAAGARGYYCDELLETADYISIHMPLTEENENLICAETIKTMKNDCIVLNMSRGGIVNEQDMYEALKNGQIGGYGCDVMATELEGGFAGHGGIQSPLFELDNFIVTPHLGAQTSNAFKDIAEMVIREVKKEFSLK